MEFLKNAEVGDKIWIKTVEENEVFYYEDIILRKLKTKINTKSGDFSIDNGKSFSTDDSNACIVEFTDDVKQFILHKRFITLIDNIKALSFSSNKVFEGFIDKLENLYNANKGV